MHTTPLSMNVLGVKMFVVRLNQKSMPINNKVIVLSSIFYIFSPVSKSRMRFITVNLTSMQQQVQEVVAILCFSNKIQYLMQLYIHTYKAYIYHIHKHYNTLYLRQIYIVQIQCFEILLNKKQPVIPLTCENFHNIASYGILP